MRGFRFQVGLAVTAVGTIGLVMLSGQQTPGGPFTAAQAAAGRTAYQAQLRELPPRRISRAAATPHQLAGSEFMDAWGRRTTRELLSFMQLTMPPTRPGRAEPGGVRSTSRRSSSSRTARPPATARSRRRSTSRSTRSPRGQAPAAAAAAPPGRGAPPAAAQAAAADAGAARAAPPAGITVDGEVKNFVPVTDAMLRNPDPADWLMIRRDYHASDYSPLNQITADNVKDLRLQWIVGDERRRRQPARADRPQRRHLPQQPRQRPAGDRREDRRADLGEPLRQQRQRRRDARHQRSTTTSSSWPRATRT